MSVRLVDAGADKVAVIKLVRELLGCPLQKAFDLVQGVPSELAVGVRGVAVLREAGAVVEDESPFAGQ